MGLTFDECNKCNHFFWLLSHPRISSSPSHISDLVSIRPVQDVHLVKQGDNHRTKNLVDVVQTTILSVFLRLNLKLMNTSHRQWSGSGICSTLYSFSCGVGLSSTRASLWMTALSSHMRPATFQRESPICRRFVCGLFIHPLARSVGSERWRNGRRNKKRAYPSRWLSTTSARDARIPPADRSLHRR